MKPSQHSELLSLEEIYSNIGIRKFHILLVITLGLIQFFDSVEVILLSFLGPILNCVWNITLWQSSLIITSVFMGMMTGSAIFGKLSDMYGRRTIITICGYGIFYFSLLCAASPTFIWVVVTRIIIGSFIGGVSAVIYSLLTEFIPVDYRGASVLVVQIFWTFGSIYISFLTYFLVSSFGWRLWLIITVCPMIILLPFIMWLPESPRFLIIKNRIKDALRVINKITSMNNNQKVSRIKTIQVTPVSLSDIFHPNYASTSCIVMFLYFVTNSNYYGMVLSSPLISSVYRNCLQNFKIIFNPYIFSNESIDNSCCLFQTSDNIKIVLIGVVGESVFLIVALIIIRFMKRKLFIQILLLAIAAIYLLMNLCLSVTNTGILMFFGRGSTSTLSGILYLYASEVFPTTIRGFSIGLCNSCQRIGAMISTLMINIVMVQKSFAGATFYYFSLNMLAFVLVFFLPYETKGRSLMQSVDDNISELQPENEKE